MFHSAAITAKLKAREEHVRETWIKAMEARIVRENLSKCQKVEGVNHYERCKDLAERYADMLKENKVRVFHFLTLPSLPTPTFGLSRSVLRGCMLTVLVVYRSRVTRRLMYSLPVSLL